jgi:hypothetical protein
MAFWMGVWMDVFGLWTMMLYQCWILLYMIALSHGQRGLIYRISRSCGPLRGEQEHVLKLPRYKQLHSPSDQALSQLMHATPY